MSGQPIAIHRAPVVSADDALAHVARLRAGLAAARKRPVARTMEILHEASVRLADRQARAPLADHLAYVIHHGTDLIQEEMEIIAALLTKSSLRDSVRAELGEYHGLDDWDRVGQILLRRQAHGILLHNLAGNALIVSPHSLALGLLTKHVNLVKASSDEPWFAASFAALLYEIEPELRNELIVCSWPGEDKAIYDAIIPEIDAVLHWGGEESRRSIAHLAAEYDVSLISHGPKLSFGILQTVLSADLHFVAKNLARDIVLWEQRACASPRFIAVLPGAGVGADDIAQALALALACAEQRWAAGASDRGRGARQAARRQRYMIELELDGLGRVLEAGRASTVIHTRVFPPAHAIDDALDRLIWVVELPSAGELLRCLDAMGSNISRLFQVAVHHGVDDSILDAIAARGMARMEHPGRSSQPAPGASHDGFHDLALLTTLHTRSAAAIHAPSDRRET